MSAARDRRRLMTWERYRRRALLLGLPHGHMPQPHWDLWHRINDRIPGWAWTLPDPHRKDSR